MRLGEIGNETRGKLGMRLAEDWEYGQIFIFTVDCIVVTRAATLCSGSHSSLV